VDALLGLAHITANKNTCPGDKSALVPGGLRLGTPALTSRNFTEEEFRQVARFIDEGVVIALKAKARAGKTLKKFKSLIETDEEIVSEIKELGDRVVEFAKDFPFPGGDEEI
jgi:glycine hydroxymethyltransferase